MHPFTIGQRHIGAGSPAYFIAELSANHNQNLSQAVEIIRQASWAGADAIKLQTYTPDTITLDSDNPYFRIDAGGLWDGRRMYDLYGEAFTPWEWHPQLQAEAHALGLDFFSTAFDDTAVDFLETLNVPLHKIASFELVDIPLIEKMARTGKPLLLSTGMATLGEIETAVLAAQNAGATQIALLKCNSAYPAPPDEMNLRAIPQLASTFQLPVGLSDHTLGTRAAAAAVTLGACIIEKHLTVSRALPGPDSAFSLEPQEFKEMVDAVRETEKMLGTSHIGPTAHEYKSRLYRRSLFVAQPIQAGELFTTANIRSIRPGHGLEPKYLTAILGKPAARNLERGTPLTWQDIKA